MNFFLTDIPDRTKKPRENGLTMMMDKGLSINDTKNFIDMCGPHTDIIKLGFDTSAISPHIETKIKGGKRKSHSTSTANKKRFPVKGLGVTYPAPPPISHDCVLAL